MKAKVGSTTSLTTVSGVQVDHAAEVRDVAAHVVEAMRGRRAARSLERDPLHTDEPAPQ
jgi:hypothetical protein